MSGKAQLLIKFAAHSLNLNIIELPALFSIIRTMDLYQMTKYESISDRIKRLAGNPSPPLHSLKPQSAAKPRLFQSPPPLSHLTKDYQHPSALNFFEKQTPSRTNTQETDRHQDQQSQTLINELLSVREGTTSKMPKRQIRAALTEELEERPFLNEGQKEMILSRWKKESDRQEGDRKKPDLSKVKSESSLKIEEIMESYNSYRQNKQQFLAELGQNSKDHQRIVSQNLKSYFEEQSSSRPDATENREQTQCRQSHIQSIWNEVSDFRDLTNLDREDQQNNVPTFQRSGKSKFDQLAELTRPKRRQSRQACGPDRRPKLNNSKMILKNFRVDKEPIQEVSTNMNAMLSPRGLRVPGKICKNSDKSMIAQPKWND